MRRLFLLLALASGAALAAPTLDFPATATGGSTIAVKVTGNEKPRDFVTIVPKGAPEGHYTNYFYVDAQQHVIVTPTTPGDYEVRLLAADGPYKTLLAKPIRITGASATVKGPATVAAGGQVTVAWTGPGNDRDYVGIGEPGGLLYIVYKYTRDGSPLKLAVPEKPGNYEFRYYLGEDDKVIASQPFTVTGVDATITAPAQVAAGAKFQFTWTGPDNPRDFITLVKAGTQEKTYDRYEYTKTGKTLTMTAPDIVGQYELRYATGQGYLTLARAPVTVMAIQGSLSGPATVVGGESFKVTWKGPDNPRNFIVIVPKDAKEGSTSGNYAYTRKESPVTLLAPLAAGDYELRYSTAERYITLARAPIKVTPAKSQPGKVMVTLASTPTSSGAVEIILDASGSMLQKLGTQRRIDIAKQTLTRLTSSTLPAGTPFAFRVFGREVDSCQTDLDVPLGPLNAAAVGARINALAAKNGAKTPIGASLEQVHADLRSVSGEKLVILVTDGEETCGGDPAAAIDSLRKAGMSTRVSIVGFALDDAQLAATFQRWSDAGGGTFFDAKDGAGLDKALTEALRPGFEVVNVGGQVLASGIVGGEAVTVPSGNHSVRIKGRAGAPRAVVVKPNETAIL